MGSVPGYKEYEILFLHLFKNVVCYYHYVFDGGSEDAEA